MFCTKRICQQFLIPVVFLKRCWLPAAALCVFVVQFVAAVWQAARDHEGSVQLPVPVFADTFIDAGNVPCGQNWSGAARLNNIGHIPVEISKVFRSCGCLEVGIEAGHVLQPRETLLVNFVVNPGVVHGARSDVAVLCEYVDPTTKTPGVAALRLCAVAPCEATSGISAIPIADPMFQASDRTSK